MLVVNFRFSDECFNETIFECELIKDKYKKWAIFLDSIMVYDNKRLKKQLQTRQPT